MFLNFGVVINAILVVLGLLWCREMFGRWRNDLAEYQGAKDASARQALIVLWVVTAVILVLLFNFSVGLLENVGVL